MNPWGKNSSKRRDTLHIIANILEITRELGNIKTQIMYKANLSFNQVNDYLKLLLGIKLLEEIVSHEKKIFKVTKKGMLFLKYFHEIEELLEHEKDNKYLNGVKMPPLELLKSMH